MNMDDWIEAQKQRLLQNSEANGEFDCLLCKLGGGQMAFIANSLCKVHAIYI
jgi:hypothetical protein